MKNGVGASFFVQKKYLLGVGERDELPKVRKAQRDLAESPTDRRYHESRIFNRVFSGVDWDLVRADTHFENDGQDVVGEKFETSSMDVFDGVFRNG